MGCRCFGEGVGPVDERFDPALIPEGENGLEFFAQDRGRTQGSTGVRIISAKAEKIRIETGA